MSKSIGVSEHPAKDEIESMWRSGLRAKAILEWLEENEQPLINSSTLSRYGQRYWSDEIELDIDPNEFYLDQATNLIEKIKDSNIGEVKRISVSKSNFSIGIAPPTDIPIQKSPEYKITIKGGSRLKGNDKPAGWKAGVFLPDMQIGFWTGKNNEFHTTHDESAIDVAHQILADVQKTYEIDLVVNAGDNLDLPAFSSHRSAPGFWSTTEMALNRASLEVAIQRKIAEDAQIVWLAGNHEQRLTNFMIDKVPSIVGLTREGDEYPVMSIPNLCRFDEYNIEYLDPYPDAEFWANEHLRFEHGTYC